MARQQEFFSSRWALVLAALGMAIGTGNIWRFPRILADNGGGAFLVPWLIFLFLWSIPLLITEMAIGKKARVGPVGAIGSIIGQKYAWMGGFVAFCTIAIMFYYSVVAGWCLNYMVESVSGGLAGVDGPVYWEGLMDSPGRTVFFHLISISIGAFIIGRGITGGVEKATKLLIPALFVLLIIAFIRGVTLDGGLNGLEFLFSPNWSSLTDYKVWLNALTQSAWSTGAGWGLIMTYAVYMRKKEDFALNSFITGLGNNSASLLAALVIFPAVFALAAQPETLISNPGPASTGLTFIYIPELFNEMPYSRVFLFIFFLALAIAAISSLIAMIELAVRSLMDFGWSRKKSTLFVWLIAFVLGAPSAIDIDFFQRQDWAWGVGLLLSGFFVAFTAIKYGVSKFREQLVNVKENDIHIGKWYEIAIKYLIPIQFIVLIGWWFYQIFPTSTPEAPLSFGERLWQWFDPTGVFSMGTCLVHWGVIIALFMIFNKKIHKNVQENREAAA